MLIALIILGEAGWWARLEPYLDYPGFEAWKFLNLGVFVVAMIFGLRKLGVPEMFRNRKETIKRELARAQEERDAALLKLKEVEARLGLLDTEVAKIKEQSVHEAAEERERIARATEAEIVKLSEQAAREIESAGKVARKELRRYTAEQSVRLATEIVRREMRSEDDARLIANNIEEMGGPAQ